MLLISSLHACAPARVCLLLMQGLLRLWSSSSSAAGSGETAMILQGVAQSLPGSLPTNALDQRCKSPGQTPVLVELGNCAEPQPK